MREILFRGRRTDNGEWVYGYLVKKHDPLLGIAYSFILVQEMDHSCITGEPTILRSEMTWFKVDLKSVGEFTGLTDKNGTRIFEGDIIEADNGVRLPTYAVVKFGENFPTMFYAMMSALYRGHKKIPAIGFYAETIDEHQHLILFQSPFVEVIGNIHDNPELIGERKDNENHKMDD